MLQELQQIQADLEAPPNFSFNHMLSQMGNLNQQQMQPPMPVHMQQLQELQQQQLLLQQQQQRPFQHTNTTTTTTSLQQPPITQFIPVQQVRKLIVFPMRIRLIL